MDPERLEQRLDAIDSRLDRLIAHLEETRRHQREIRELKDDLGRIATDVFASVTTELEDVAPQFDSADLVHLGKRILRNTRNLSQLLDRLESLSDFVNDTAPLQKSAFLNLLSTLDELDREGYFAFLSEVRALVDRVVVAFKPEDLRLLGDNIVTILQTLRGLTQPEIMQAVNNALSVYRNIDTEIDQDVSYLALIRQARSVEVRRGLAMGLRFLKNVSSPDSSVDPAPPESP